MASITPTLLSSTMFSITGNYVKAQDLTPEDLFALNSIINLYGNGNLNNENFYYKFLEVANQILMLRKIIEKPVTKEWAKLHSVMTIAHPN